MAQAKKRGTQTRSAKPGVNPHVAAAQHNGQAAAKVVRKNAEVAASKVKVAAVATAGGIALGAGIVWAFGSAFARGLRG